MHNSIECCCCNSTASTITTTITVDNKENDDDETKHFTNAPTTMTAKVSVLINEPPVVVLRQRLQEHIENKISDCTSCTTPSLATTPRLLTAKNKIVELSLTEFLGSNVQQIALTPSPSPRLSPRKLSQDDITIIADASTTNSSNSLQANASSTIPCSNDRNHSLSQQNGLALNNISSGDNLLQRRRNEKLPPNTLPLPLRTATAPCCDDFDEFDLSTPYTPVPTSSTSSTTTPTPSIPSTTSTSALPSPIRKMSSSNAQLLQWNDMPEYLQFNPYVLNGYRPLQTFKGCLLSLFYWHNETINILSHAIPIIYILIIVPGLMPWESGYRFLSFCHLFGSVAPWCGSFIYHLFMNIDKGENVYYRLLKVDMVGIWVSQSFGALPFVTASTFCFGFKLKWGIIISYYLLALWGLYKALTASSPWQRRLCFALPFTMRSILMFLRTQGLVGGNRTALWHVYLQDVISLIGGAIGAMRIPEKWCPGLVDFYLNSHNIMHVLVVVAVYSMYKATLKDLEWISTISCDAFNNTTNVDIPNNFAANIEL